MDLFLASIRNLRWLRNIKKSNAVKTQIYVFRGLRLKKVALKPEALTGEFYKVLLTILENSH